MGVPLQAAQARAWGRKILIREYERIRRELGWHRPRVSLSEASRASRPPVLSHAVRRRRGATSRSPRTSTTRRKKLWPHGAVPQAVRPACPAPQSDGAQAAVTSRYADMIFIPIETSGEGDVNAPQPRADGPRPRRRSSAAPSSRRRSPAAATRSTSYGRMSTGRRTATCARPIRAMQLMPHYPDLVGSLGEVRAVCRSTDAERGGVAGVRAHRSARTGAGRGVCRALCA